MTLSEVERQTVLNIIYSSLSNPDGSGNRFLSQLLNNTKDGFFSLNLLKGLVTDLKDYPLPYLQHCINYERRRQPDQQRLELDSGQLQVRIARQTDKPTTSNETDPFGFLVKSSSSPTTSAGKRSVTSLSTSSPAAVLESESPQKKQKRSSHFTPYQPSFNFKALAANDDEGGSMDILPVFYDGGKFYQDASFFSASTAEKATKTTPSYEKLDILPVGVDQTTSVKIPRLSAKEKTCWNCGLPDHEMPDCPEPTDRQRVEVNRALFLAGNGTGGGSKRYYEELVYKDYVSGLEPGRLSANLRDALGMYHYDDEPPYYRNMRKHGYPPGYTGSYVDQERVMRLVGGNQLDEGVPDLQIFDHNQDNDKIQLVEKEPKKTHQEHQERIRMVTYPGLYRTPELPRYNHQTPNADRGSHHQRQQQYYQWSSYQQQQEQQQHYQQPPYEQHYYHQQQQQYHYEQPLNYVKQQSYPSQDAAHRQNQYQAYSPYYQHYPQLSSSHYYQQSYHPAYGYGGQNQQHHQPSPDYSHNKNAQQTQLYEHSMTAPFAIYNDQPPPPPQNLGEDIPPPPPPPPSNSLDDIPPPPPPPSNSLDDIPPPPPSDSLDDIPPPPPSDSLDDIPPPPPPSNGLDDIPPSPPTCK